MRTNLLVLLLSFFPYFLSAQIYVKLNLDDDGLYSVVIKTETPIGDAVVGSGQITITAPFGGFEVGDITSINGEWDTSPDVINQSMSTAISHDYFFIGMRDGDGISGMDVCEEQTLLTFRNVGVNTGRAELITREDPIVTREIDFQNNPYHDLSIFDSSAGSIVNISGTYNTITTTHTDETKTICEGESYLFHGRALTEAGIYRDTIQGSNGCDNYAVVNLLVNTNGNLTQKIVLQPDETNGKDASVRGYWPDDNFGNGLKYYVYTWTHSGNSGPGRALIDFDLAQIPSNAVIEHAALSLYSTGGTNVDLADHSGENASIIERITSTWEESSVTWNTQPTTTNNNSLSIDQTTSDNQDFLNMDVTDMVGDMVADPSNSHGFMMRLETEVQYRNLSFYTSSYEDAGKRPKLEITYTVPNETNLNDTITICRGESYDFNGTILTDGGTYVDTLLNGDNCANVSTLELVVLETVYTEVTASICEGEGYEFNGEILKETGTYVDTLQNNNGCPSINLLNLVVLESAYTELTASICAGESYLFKGVELTEIGTYVDTLQNDNGCDNINILNLVILENAYTEVVDTICQGENYDFNGAIVTEEGKYIDTLQSSNGCDSIRVLDLVVLDSSICFDTIIQADIVITNIQKLSVTSAQIDWTSTRVPTHYELQARIKDTSVWETAKRLNTNATKAYFYGPANKIFETRVVGYYADGTQSISEIVELSTFRED